MSAEHSPATHDILLNTLRPFAALGGPDDGCAAAFPDLPDDVVLYENSGKAITAGDVRAARKVVSQYAQHAPYAPSAIEPNADTVPRSRYNACNDDWLREKANAEKMTAALARLIASIAKHAPPLLAITIANGAKENADG